MNKVIYKPKKRINIEKCCFLHYFYENNDVKKLFKILSPRRIDKICHSNNQYEKQY